MEGMEKRPRFSDLLILILLYLFAVSLPALSGLPGLEQTRIRFVFRLAFFLFLALFGFLRFPKPGKFAWRYLPFFLLPFTNLLVIAIQGGASFSFSYDDGIRLVDLFLTVAIEETLFRVLPFIGLAGEKEKRTWIVLSSVLFSLCHLAGGSWMQGVYCLGLGLALASLSVYGGGAYYAFLLHFAFNLFNGEFVSYLGGTNLDAIYFAVNVSAGIAFAAYYLFLIFLRFKRGGSSQRYTHR